MNATSASKVLSALVPEKKEDGALIDTTAATDSSERSNGKTSGKTSGKSIGDGAPPDSSPFAKILGRQGETSSADVEPDEEPRKKMASQADPTWQLLAWMTPTVPPPVADVHVVGTSSFASESAPAEEGPIANAKSIANASSLGNADPVASGTSIDDTQSVAKNTNAIMNTSPTPKTNGTAQAGPNANPNAEVTGNPEANVVGAAVLPVAKAELIPQANAIPRAKVPPVANDTVRSNAFVDTPLRSVLVDATVTLDATSIASASITADPRPNVIAAASVGADSGAADLIEHVVPRPSPGAFVVPSNDGSTSSQNEIDWLATSKSQSANGRSPQRSPLITEAVAPLAASAGTSETRAHAASGASPAAAPFPAFSQVTSPGQATASTWRPAQPSSTPDSSAKLRAAEPRATRRISPSQTDSSTPPESTNMSSGDGPLDADEATTLAKADADLLARPNRTTPAQDLFGAGSASASPSPMPVSVGKATPSDGRMTTHGGEQTADRAVATRLLDAATKNADLHSIKKGIHAGVDLGDAGRVEIAADHPRQHLDVRLEAEHAATGRALASHAVELTHELRSFDARVTVAGHSFSQENFSSSNPSTDHGDRNLADSGRTERAGIPAQADESTSGPRRLRTAAGRVRIVL